MILCIARKDRAVVLLNVILGLAEFKVLMILCPVHFSGFCLQWATLTNEATATLGQRAAALLLAIKAVGLPNLVFLSHDANPLCAQPYQLYRDTSIRLGSKYILLSCFSHVQLFVTPWTSPPSSSVQGILQEGLLDWVAMPFSRGSSQPKDQTQVSCLLCWQACSLPLVAPGKVTQRKYVEAPAACCTRTKSNEVLALTR